MFPTRQLDKFYFFHENCELLNNALFGAKKNKAYAIRFGYYKPTFYDVLFVLS
jgi:hypothetical protein